jgi:hypothetical protein
MSDQVHRCRALVLLLLAGFVFSPALTASPSPASRDVGKSPRTRPLSMRASRFGLDDGESMLASTESHAAPLSPDQRAQNFANDIPAGEINLGSLFGSVPGHDLWAWAAGKPDGQLVLLTAESFAIKAARSADGGATFGPEILVAGGPGQPSAITFDSRSPNRTAKATLSADGKVYLVYINGDPQGDWGLRFVRSDDMGQSWTAPVDLVKRGDPQHGVWELGEISANGAGRVAVTFREQWERKDGYVLASSDRGQSWTTPVRLDRGDTTGDLLSTRPKVVVDAAGTIHAVFRQNRGQGYQIWFTRSTDGGVTFDTERNFDAVLPPGERTNSDCPDLAVANDGSVLVAFWDRFGASRLYGVRSTDNGVTFTKTFQVDVFSGNTAVWPRFAVARGAATVLLGVIRSDQQLVVWRSPDNGASFGAAATVVTSAYRNPYIVSSVGYEVQFTRTGLGHWLVAWEDVRNAGADSTLTDIYARISTDDGLTWGAEQRVDRYPPGASESRLTPATTSTGADNLFVGYLDRRDGEGTQWNVYANRSPAVPADFSSNERRVDQDSFTESYFGRRDFDDAAVTTDGASHVYVAMTRTVAGSWSDIYVAASSDRGKTFPLLRRVSTHAAGTADCVDPQINAYPDGTVYVAFLIKSATGTSLVFNRSRDFGQTWMTTQHVVGSATSWDYDWGTFRLVSQSNGNIYLVWSDQATVFLSRSTDGGDTFSTQDIDQDNRGTNFNPALCAQGDKVFAVFASLNDTGEYWSVFAVVSQDRGANWGARTQLRPEGVGAYAYDTDVACDGTGGALAVWADEYEGGLHSSRYDGSSWQPDSFINSPANYCLYWPRALFVTPSIVLVSYSSYCGGSAFDWDPLWLSRSVDGGSTFGPPLQVDQAAPQPLARSIIPSLAADGLGRVWVSWSDRSNGAWSVAVRMSQDNGASFGATYRVGRTSPQGVRSDLGENYQQTAALPGAAFFVFGGERSGLYGDVILNAWDAEDFDRDGASLAADCNDADPTVRMVPSEVAGLAVTKAPGGTELAWVPQASIAGPGTTYDLVSGWLSELRASRSYSGAYCLKNEQASAPYTDTHPAPPLGDGYYYLIRGGNVCGTSSYGNASYTPDPRDMLDSSGPCP